MKKKDIDDFVYCVETNKKTTLFKQIDLNRASDFQEFEVIKSIHKEKGIKTPLKDLNALLAIDFFNIFDKQSYFQLFFGNNIKTREDFERHHDEFSNTIQDKYNRIRKTPEIFKKFNHINVFNGCFIIFTNITDKKKIKLVNSNNTIAKKIKYTNKTKDIIEVEEMCLEYEHFVKKTLEMEQIEINRFLSLPKEEKQHIINDILYNTLSDDTDEINNNNDSLLINNIINEKIKIDDLIKVENKDINTITDINYLNELLNTSVENEEYEKCSLIKQRINSISTKK